MHYGVVASLFIVAQVVERGCGGDGRGSVVDDGHV